MKTLLVLYIQHRRVLFLRKSTKLKMGWSQLKYRAGVFLSLLLLWSVCFLALVLWRGSGCFLHVEFLSSPVVLWCFWNSFSYWSDVLIHCKWHKKNTHSIYILCSVVRCWDSAVFFYAVTSLVVFWTLNLNVCCVIHCCDGEIRSPSLKQPKCVVHNILHWLILQLTNPPSYT